MVRDFCTRKTARTVSHSGMNILNYHRIFLVVTVIIQINSMDLATDEYYQLYDDMELRIGDESHMLGS